jgi:hypothetical protein
MKRLQGSYVGKTPTWGLTNNTGVWSLESVLAQSVQNTWPGSNPVASLSPVLWFDFADSSVVTLSGQEITQIKDKGSKSWNLAKSTTGPSQGTWTNGLKCCEFGSSSHSNYLRYSTTGVAVTIGEIYAVVDASYGSTFPTFNLLMGGIEVVSGNTFYINGWQGRTGLLDNNQFNQAYVNNSSTNAFNNGPTLPTINNRALLRVTRADQGSVSPTDGFQISKGGGQGWYGQIGEIILFSSQLSTSNRTKLQSYLATKWALTLS